MLYAVAFDLDTDILKSTYHVDNYPNAYKDIRIFLEKYGFENMQGSLYFGTNVDAVTCVTAIQALAKEYDWFYPSVRDIRMLRIEESNDLMPAVEIVVDK